MERISAAIQGTPSDRPPIAPLLSLYGAKLTQCNLKDYYSIPEAYAEGQKKVAETFQPDVIFGPFSMALEGLAAGSELRFYSDQAPNLKRPAFENSKDFLHSFSMKYLDHPVYNYFFKSIQYLSSEFSSTCPIAAITMSPVDFPIMALGIEGWLNTVLFEKEMADEILNISCQLFLEKSRLFSSAGAAFLVIPLAFSNPDIVTGEMAQSMIHNVLTPLFSKLTIPVVIHSGGARLMPFLELFNNLPNVAGFVVNPGEDMHQARTYVGNGKILGGNINGPAMSNMTPEEVEQACSKLLKSMEGDLHFLMATSAADIPLNTDIKTILSLKAAAEKKFFPLQRNSQKTVKCIACSIFKKELETLLKKETLDINIDYLSSMYHMTPDKMNNILENEIGDSDENTILLFGDCCSKMHEFEERPSIFRPPGANCVEILMGKDVYKKIREQGVFVFMPEWTHRWKEVFKQHLGLTGNIAKEFIKDLVNELVYLDTGVIPIPHDILRDIEEYSGLKVQIMKTDTNHLLEVLEAAVAHFNKGPMSQ